MFGPLRSMIIIDAQIEIDLTKVNNNSNLLF